MNLRSIPTPALTFFAGVAVGVWLAYGLLLFFQWLVN